MEKEKMAKESRDELLERILEETARNPYKKRPLSQSRPSVSSSGRTAVKPAERATAATSGSNLYRTTAVSETKPVSQPTAQAQEKIERTQVFSSSELNQLSEQAAAVQTQDQKPSRPASPLQQELTQVLPAQPDFKMDTQPQPEISPQEMQSAAEKIQKIKQQKAAAAKAAIMRKAEIDNSRMMQNAESVLPPEPPVFTAEAEDDEKVNLFMPEDNEYDEFFGEEEYSLPAKLCDIAIYAASVMFVILVVFCYILGFATVSGDSMMPTLSDSQKLLVMNAGYTPQRGDVVIIDNQTAALMDENESVTEKKALDCMIAKRIIAVGGDTVDIDFEKGTVSVNGNVLEEGYISEPTTRDEGAFTYPLTIPQGYVFVLGDNRNLSKDSRHSDIGLVPADEVKAKVIMKVLPLSDFGTVE